MNLTTLTDAQLEDLENDALCQGDNDLHDLVIAEMRRRPDFCPTSYSLMEMLESDGWDR